MQYDADAKTMRPTDAAGRNDGACLCHASNLLRQFQVVPWFEPSQDHAPALILMIVMIISETMTMVLLLILLLRLLLLLLLLLLWL